MQLYLLDWLKHPGLTPPIGEPRFTLWHDEQRKLVMGGIWVGGAPFAYLTSLKVTTTIRLLAQFTTESIHFCSFYEGEDSHGYMLC